MDSIANSTAEVHGTPTVVLLIVYVVMQLVGTSLAILIVVSVVANRQKLDSSFHTILAFPSVNDIFCFAYNTCVGLRCTLYGICPFSARVGNVLTAQFNFPTWYNEIFAQLLFAVTEFVAIVYPIHYHGAP